jgi:hypothetical protein
MTTNAFPLSWPPHFPRSRYREHGRFKTKLENALKNVQTSLRLFAADSGKKLSGLVISSNCSLGVNDPSDPGVAVWFTWDDLQVCIPVDRYHDVASNLQAVHHIIEARRVELRHGTLALVRATLHGFLALPAPAKPRWWEVLEVSETASSDQIRSAYLQLASKHHPDKGGDHAKMAEINRAYLETQQSQHE